MPRWNKVNVLWYRITQVVALFQLWKAAPSQLCNILMATRGCSRDYVGGALYWWCWDRKRAIQKPASRGEAQGETQQLGLCRVVVPAYWHLGGRWRKISMEAPKVEMGAVTNIKKIILLIITVLRLLVKRLLLLPQNNDFLTFPGMLVKISARTTMCAFLWIILDYLLWRAGILGP